MQLGKALKAALAFAAPKADPSSTQRYVRIAGHVYGPDSREVRGHKWTPDGLVEDHLFWTPQRRGYVYAFNGVVGVVIGLDFDCTFAGDIAVDADNLRQTISVAKDGITSIVLHGEHSAWFYTASGTGSACNTLPGARIAAPALPEKLTPFPDIHRFKDIMHAASVDEVDRRSLCGVRLVGDVAEAADEHRIAMMSVAMSPLTPVVFPRAMLKSLPKPGRIMPAIALAHGRVFLHVGEELRFATAEDRNFPLPERPRAFDHNIAVPRARLANAVRFATQTSQEDICELTLSGKELHVAGCGANGYTSHERFDLHVEMPQSTRFVRGRLLHAALQALDEFDTVNLHYLPSPYQPVCLTAGTVSETIWPLEFKQSPVTTTK